MKILLSTLVLLFSISTIYAQPQKGSALLEGSASWLGNSSISEQPLADGSIRKTRVTSMNYGLSPRYGIFVSDDLALGLGIDFKNSTRRSKVIGNGGSSPATTSSSYSVSLNPYATKFTRLANGLYFTATLNLLGGIGEQSSSSDTADSNTEFFELEVNGTPGLTYFVSERWALRSGLGKIFFNRREVTTPVSIDELNEQLYTGTDYSYGLTAQLNTFTIGFQYFFAKKGAE